MAKTHYPLAGANQWTPLGRTYDELRTTGNVYYVNSVGGTDAAGNGLSPDAPFASINFAITQCTANNGDKVLVLPGHVETINAAGACAFGVAGVSVIGLGYGNARPKFNFTTSTAATVTVTAANCSLENVWMDLTGFAAVVTGLNITAADFTLRNVRIIQATAVNQCATAITTSAAANRLTIDNCQIYGTSDAVTQAILIIGGDGISILNSFFEGGYSSGVGAIAQTTTTTTNIRIYNCYINNLTASCTKAITLTAASTGMISECKMQILSGTAPITGAAMSWLGANYYAATIATAGTLI